jgi:hypothetical protein
MWQISLHVNKYSILHVKEYFPLFCQHGQNFFFKKFSFVHVLMLAGSWTNIPELYYMQFRDRSTSFQY